MKRLLSIAVLSMLCSSCATLYKNSDVTIKAINSQDKLPIAGALLYEKDKMICEIPCNKKLGRWENKYSFTIKHEDYLDKNVSIEPEINNYVIFDCVYLIIPPLGIALLGIDLSTNSFKTYKRNYAISMDINSGKDSIANKTATLKEFISKNFNVLRIEAYHNDSSKNITTLSEMTGLKKNVLKNIIFNNQTTKSAYEKIIDIMDSSKQRNKN